MPADCQPARLGDLRRGGASAAERYGQPHAPRDLPAAEPEDRIVRVGPRRAERRERFHRHAGQVARGSPRLRVGLRAPHPEQPAAVLRRLDVAPRQGGGLAAPQPGNQENRA